MGMYQHLINFFDVVSVDEDLLRLLVYKSENFEDDPLSPNKPNIIGTPTYYKVLNESIKRAPKSTDLSTKNNCRICMYLGYNTKTTNIKTFNQDIVFDVYVHISDFEEIDCRSLKICDRLNAIVHDKHISGIGKVVGYKTYPINDAPDGYIGYKMVFTFGSTK